MGKGGGGVEQGVDFFPGSETENEFEAECLKKSMRFSLNICIYAKWWKLHVIYRESVKRLCSCSPMTNITYVNN